MTPGTSIRLTKNARMLWPDIGTRRGTLVRLDGWAVVRWDRTEFETRVPLEAIEAAEVAGG